MDLLLEQAWGSGPLILTEKPKRIVSLVPSVTETMLEWGGALVGRSSFCIMPTAQVGSIVRVGGTKTPNHNRIMALKPDLIIANLEENQKADIQALQNKGVPVWITYPEDLPSTLSYLQQLRQLCPSDMPLADAALLKFKKFAQRVVKHPNPQKVGVLIWKDPWMAVGQQTYTDSLLQASGLQNAVVPLRYPVLSEQELYQLSMDILLLPSEPYAFTSKHQLELQARFKTAGKTTKVALFNGENLFWSGPRAIQAVKDLESLFLNSKSGAHENACV